MFLKSKSSACLIGSVLTLSLAAAAQAQSTPAAAPAESQAGMRVSIDPVTRQIRPVTAEESRALQGQAAPAALGAKSKPVVLSSRTGAQGVKLGEEHMSYARAARTAAGVLALDCLEGDDHTDHAHGPVARQELHLD